jgi:hypothetical protein
MEETMRLQMITGVSNVIRFPIERRAVPTLELLRQIAPDPREVLQIMEAFGLDRAIHELRGVADRRMAAQIREGALPEFDGDRRTVLAGMLAPFVQGAVDLCRQADAAMASAATAQERLLFAQTEGGYWLPPLAALADGLTDAAARLMVEAYVACEEAEGAARAIDLALQGKAWQPPNLTADAEALFFGEAIRAQA